MHINLVFSALTSSMASFLYFCALITTLSAYPAEIDPSFRRLESGENSDEVINQCCKRESRFITLSQGTGIDEDELRIDVGYCQQHCETQKLRPLKRDEFDKFLKKYPDMDPIQIFLSLQNQQLGMEPNLTLTLNLNDTTSGYSVRSSSASCISATCQPTSTRREIHFNMLGFPREVEVIESCDCAVQPESCQRVANPLRLHPGTPYEKVVDLGKCEGPCGTGATGLTCLPIRNRTVSVEGPNGVQCLNVVEECHCVGGCYRSRQFHKVYDFTEAFENKNSNVSETDADGSGSEELDTAVLVPVIKEIDIGRCDGSCKNIYSTSKCVIWSGKNETCLSSLYGGQSLCAPTTLTSHFYTDKFGESHKLISVTACGCR